MRKKTTWIVVADGARARIFSNSGRGTGLQLVDEKEDADARRPTRDLGSDKPGRSFESADGSRHAMTAKADWHDSEKARFLKELATAINAAAAAGTFDALVVAAPPRALGILRKSLAAATTEKLHGELAKDLTGTAAHDLPPLLADLVKT